MERDTKIIFDKFNNTLSRGNQSRRLGARDSLVLEFLLLSGDNLSAKNDIIDYAWQGLTVTDASLSKSISLLRGALADLSPGIEIIVTVPRLGYKIKHTEFKVQSSDLKSSDIDIDTSSDVEESLSAGEKIRSLFYKLKNRAFNPLILTCLLYGISISLIIYSAFIFYNSMNYDSVEYQDHDLSIIQLSDRMRLMSIQKIPLDVKNELEKINCFCDVFFYQEDKNSYVSIYLKNERRAINMLVSNNKLEEVDHFIYEVLSQEEGELK
ncbi:transcriptional regulator [Aeromonas veronii]